MKPTRHFIAALTLWITCSNFLTDPPRPAITWDRKTDVDNLLPADVVRANVMGSPINSPRFRDLTARMKMATDKNQDWYTDYVERNIDEPQLPYDEKLGLSEKEYEELLSYGDLIVYVALSNEVITIMKDSTTISFIGSGPLNFLKDVKINLDKNTVKVHQEVLAFHDSTIIPASEDSGFTTDCQGYMWELISPRGFRWEVTSKGSGNGKWTQFFIGRMNDSGKTCMRIRWREITNGLMSKDEETVVVF